MNIRKYKDFLDTTKHEVFAFNYIVQKAVEKGFMPYNEKADYSQGDKILFVFRRKLIALVELGEDLTEGANMIVSHIDSPRLDVMPNDPFEKNEDGIFWKTIPYGGIVSQVWLDRPLSLVGRLIDDNQEEVWINTEKDGIAFTVSSLLPHLGGRNETSNLKCEKLLVRMGDETVEEELKKRYGITKENLQLAELSFVPAGKAFEVGFDKNQIASYGHDDRVCAFAELEAIFNSKKSDKTKIALFTSYEETGSRQSTGAQSQFIDDIFLELTGDERSKRRAMKKTSVISADVCAGYDSKYGSHFEKNCKAICGKGTAIVPFLGNKGGNDATLEMREFIKKLCKDNNILFQLETTKLGEGGGGTVSSFFNTKGMEIIDIGVPVLAMHSPQELIDKNDLKETYKLYKVFFENNKKIL